MTLTERLRTLLDWERLKWATLIVVGGVGFTFTFVVGVIAILEIFRRIWDRCTPEQQGALFLGGIFTAAVFVIYHALPDDETVTYLSPDSAMVSLEQTEKPHELARNAE